MKRLIINGVNFDVENFEENLSNVDDTQKQSKGIEFSFTTIGKSQYNLYNEFFKKAKDFNVIIAEGQEPLKAVKESFITSYSTNQLKEDTKVHFKVNLREKDGDESDLTEQQKILVNVMSETLNNKMMFKTLIQALEKKGIVTSEELSEIMKENFEEDFQKYRKELLDIGQ